MGKRQNRKKGFTLIELIVAMGMALMVVTTAISMTIILRREFTGGSDKLEVVQNGRIVLDRLTRDLRQANEIVTELTDYSLGGSGAYEIEIENGHQASDINYIKYFLSGTDLVRQSHHYSFANDPNTWVEWNSVDLMGTPPELVVDQSATVANFVTQLEFWFNGENLILFEIRASKNNQNSHMRTQVFGRNI